MPTSRNKANKSATTTFEVLTETKVGHRTVHRVDATDEHAAESLVQDNVAATTKVLAVAVNGKLDSAPR